MGEMKSYRVPGYGEPLVEMDDPTPEPQGREAVVRITGCGVCHSDLHIWDGHFDLGGGNKVDLSRAHKLPLTMGHEITGTVAALGPEASGVAVGDPVIVYPWIGCGDCAHCNGGDDHFCARPRALGVNLDGGYADHVLVPDAKFLFPMGDLPSELACTYACSGLTAYSALKKVEPRARGASLLLVGAGGVGFQGLTIARAIFPDTQIIVADIDQAKRDAAMAAGADLAVDPADPGARKELMKATGGGPQGAVDFVGSDKSLGFATGVLGAGGIVAVVGLFGGAMPLSVPLLPLKRLTICGSYVGSPQEMRELMELVVAGKVAPLPVATRPMAEANQTLNDLRDGKIVGRVVLTP